MPTRTDEQIMVPFVFENRPSQAYNCSDVRLNATWGLEMSDTSDELRWLVERCNGGDEEAWQEFWSRYHNKISIAVRRLCPSTSGEVEDIVQEVFFHLFMALKSYDPARPIEAYILGIARKVAISYIRKESAAKRNISSTAGWAIDPPLCPHPEESFTKAQESQLLRESLNELSEDSRRLIEMKYCEGLSYNEISSRSGVKEVTLRAQVSRSLSTLSKIYRRRSASTRRTHDE